MLVFTKLTKMATKIQQILEAAPNESVLFGSWLSSQGLDARGQNQVYLLLYRHTTRNLARVAM